MIWGDPIRTYICIVLSIQENVLQFQSLNLLSTSVGKSPGHCLYEEEIYSVDAAHPYIFTTDPKPHQTGDSVQLRLSNSPKKSYAPDISLQDFCETNLTYDHNNIYYIIMHSFVRVTKRNSK
jgi:hypothetical protein